MCTEQPHAFFNTREPQPGCAAGSFLRRRQTATIIGDDEMHAAFITPQFDARCFRARMFHEIVHRLLSDAEKLDVRSGG